jgi:hypothetical protein
VALIARTPESAGGFLARGFCVTDEQRTDDLGSTTIVYNKVGLGWLPRALRNRLTPGTVGSAVAALTLAIGYVVSAKHDIKTTEHDVQRLEAANEESKKTVAELRHELGMLYEIKTQIAVINDKLDVQASELERQRAEWDRIHRIAESPQHGRRKPR